MQRPAIFISGNAGRDGSALIPERNLRVLAIEIFNITKDTASTLRKQIKKTDMYCKIILVLQSEVLTLLLWARKFELFRTKMSRNVTVRIKAN